MMMKDNVINLVTPTRDQPAYAETALPVLTYDNAMRFHFNGERIDLLHFGPAHTTGDTAVIFRGHKTVHMGDVYNNAGYPFIDADNGGSLNGVIEFCSKVLEQIDESYTVVPGHGPVADAKALADYVAMLTTIRDRMSALIGSGATLEQVVAARPTSEWDERKGMPGKLPEPRLLEPHARAALARDRHPARGSSSGRSSRTRRTPNAGTRGGRLRSPGTRRMSRNASGRRNIRPDSNAATMPCWIRD